MLNKENSSGWNERTLDKEKKQQQQTNPLLKKKKKPQRSKEHQKMVIKGNCIDKYNTNLIGGGGLFS